LILVDRGTYRGGIVVSAAKHDLTIRGVDRTGVVLGGGDVRRNGISVYADGVSILNMSAHNFPVDAFHWHGADRFRASYLTVWNVGKYGIYAEDGEQGTVDHDYVSGAADAAYYIGECKHCRATLSHVVASLSAVGYSGTNASEVTIRDSVWDRNGAGILPNTYANEAHPPARDDHSQHRHQKRSGASGDQHPARGVHRDRDRGRRWSREPHPGESRHRKRAVRHRRLPDGAQDRVRPERSA
jgi:hypothetical protein